MRERNAAEGHDVLCGNDGSDGSIGVWGSRATMMVWKNNRNRKKRQKLNET